MAFNINAQIILSQPKNLNNVTKQITQQLSKATNIQLKLGNTQQLNNIGRQLTTIANSFNKLNANLKSTRTSISALNSSFNQAASAVGGVAKAQSGLATQTSRTNASLKQQSSLLGGLAGRFGSVAKQAIAFGLISRPIYDLQRALTGAVKDAVAFEKEIVKISQITGQSVTQLANLSKQITQLSTSLGVGANELAETARIIAQTGRTAQETETILRSLARSTLAPTFGKITDTTEGLVAALAQFNLKASDSEAVLGSLNKISKNFAVESEDLISAIRRTGGVFAQAAGQSKGTVAALQELSAIFTAVRSTTRESADTIAAGLRTIFSRIQRRGTIEFLKQFNIELTDAKGNFVGVFPAFDQLSKRLDTLIKQGDALTLSAIAEELGGIRQIGKLLPAIAQFDKARKALEDAQKGAVEGLGVDVAKGLDTIDNRLKRVRETFNQLIRTVFESDAFQNFTKNILTAAENFLKFGNSITQALEPVLPLLTTLGAFKIGAGISGLLRGGGGAVSTVTGQASATANKQTATAAQKTAAATTTQNNLIINTNKILTNILNQVGNLSSNNSAGFNKVVSAINSKPVAVGGGLPGRRRASGGSIPKFANGGRVYGPSHAAGGVIAELEGGEYVVPKGYQPGGSVRAELNKLRGTSFADPKAGAAITGKGTVSGNTLKAFSNAQLKASSFADKDEFGGAFLRPSGIRRKFIGENNKASVENELRTTPAFSQFKDLIGKGGKGQFKKLVNDIISTYTNKNKFVLTAGSLGQGSAEALEDDILDGVQATIKSSSQLLGKKLGFTGPADTARALRSANIDQVVGNIFESILSFAGVPFNPSDPDPPNAPVDFPRGLNAKISSQFGLAPNIPTEAKSSFTEDNLSTFNKKVQNFNLDEAKRELLKVFADLGRSLSTTELTTITGAKTGAQAAVIAGKSGFATESTKTGQQTSFKLSKRASGGTIQKFNTGGEVPVRISNGEMVVSDPAEVAANKGSLQRINKLAAGGFASGYVAKGPGTGKSDSIYTTLPEGAFVVNAASTKKFLGRARGGGVQRFQGGGQPALNALVGAKDTAINNLVPRLRAFVGTQEQAAVAMKALTRATAQGATAGEALARAEFAVTQATAQETRAKERAAIVQKNNNVATRSVTDSLNLLKNSARKASGGTLFGSPRDKAAAGGGGGALGAVFALSALTSTLGATDSALGKFAQELTTVLFTLTAFSGILPTGSVSGIKGALSTGLSGRAGIAGIGIGAGGTALGGLGAGLAGGFVGKSIGNAIADATVGQEQKIGRITGSQSQGAAQQRAGLGFGGAVLGGAAAGAALGTFIAPGIGTAIGAAVGAGGGAIVGALTTPFDVIAKQAAFEVAQDLQDGGKAVKTSLNTLAKDFNQITFGRFGDRLNKEVTNFTDAFPELTEQLFQGGDALKSRTGAFKDAISTFSEAFKPEDIARASEQSSKAFDQFVNSLSDEELQRLSQAESTEQLNQALIRTAKAGGDFGKQVLRSRTDIAKAEALSKAAQLSESGSVNTSKILTRLASTFDFVNGNAEELENAFSEAARAEGIKGDALTAARKEVGRFAKDQREAATEQSKESVRRAQLNRVLTESAQKVNAFTLALDNSIKGLSESLARSSEKFDLFAQRVSDIESGAAVARIDTGLSNRGNDEVISILERSTGQNLQAFRNLEQVQANLPNIIKNAVESIPETAGAEQATAAVIRSLQQQSGLAISGDFEEGLSRRIRGLIDSRQDQADSSTILGGKALKEALNDETKLRELLGPVVQKQIDIFNTLVQESENLRKEFEKRINFEISRLQRVSAFEKSILEKRLANEDIVNGILQRNTNVIDKSLNVLQRRISQVGGTSDLGALVSQRGQALAAKQQLEQQIALGDTSNETANALIKLTNQFANADKALKQFTEDTSFAASIQQEAARVQQGISGAAGGLDQIIGAAFGGDSEAVQAILSQVNVTERVLNGIGSLQDTFQVFSSAGSPIVKALADARFGAGGSETVQSALRFQLAQRLQGTPLGGVAGTFLKSISDGSRDLATLAQRANSFAEQQISILTSIEAQNATAISAAQSGTDPFSQSVNTFSTAVQNFATTVASGGAGVFAGGAPARRAAGGIIYRNQGGISDGTLAGAFASRFSKGTDTIPAMLSPGEYVVRASAVRNVGVGTLDAINNSNVSTASTGGVIYRQQGGLTWPERLQRDVLQTRIAAQPIEDWWEFLKPFARKINFGALNEGDYPKFNKIAQTVFTNVLVDDYSKLPTLFSSNDGTISGQAIPIRTVFNSIFKPFSNELFELVLKNAKADSILKTFSDATLQNAIKQGTSQGIYPTFFANRGTTFRESLVAASTEDDLFSRAQDVLFGTSEGAPLGYSPAFDLVSAINNTQPLSTKDRKTLYAQYTDQIRKQRGKEEFLKENRRNVNEGDAGVLKVIKDKLTDAINYDEQLRKFVPTLDAGFMKAIINSDDIDDYIENLTYSQFEKNKSVGPEFLDKVVEDYIGSKRSIFYGPQFSDKLAKGLNINSANPIGSDDQAVWIRQLANNFVNLDDFSNLIQAVGRDNYLNDPLISAVLKKAISGEGGAIFASANPATVGTFGISQRGGTAGLSGLLSVYNSKYQAYQRAGGNAFKKLSSLSAESALLQSKNFVGLPRYSDAQLEKHFEFDFGGDANKLINPDTGKPFNDAAVQAEIDRRKNAKDAERVPDPKEERKRAQREKIKEKQRLRQKAEEKQRQQRAKKFDQLLSEDNSFTNLIRKRSGVRQQLENITADIKANRIGREAGIARISKLNILGNNLSALISKRYFNILKKAGLDKDPLLDRLTDSERSALEKHNTLVASGLGGKTEDFAAANQVYLSNFALGPTENNPNARAIQQRIAFARLLYFGDARATQPFNLPKFHTGGLIGSFAQGGEVPIMAQKGEYVMSRKAVQQNGLGVLNAMNGGVVHKQEGGFLGRRSGGVLNRNMVVSLDARNASALLQDSILNAGSSVNKLWGQTFTTFMEQFTQAVTPIQGLVNMPKQFTHTIQPVDIQGTDGITKDISTNVQRLLVPMVEKIVEVIQGNNVVKPGAM